MVSLAPIQNFNVSQPSSGHYITSYCFQNVINRGIFMHLLIFSHYIPIREISVLENGFETYISSTIICHKRMTHMRHRDLQSWFLPQLYLFRGGRSNAEIQWFCATKDQNALHQNRKIMLSLNCFFFFGILYYHD